MIEIKQINGAVLYRAEEAKTIKQAVMAAIVDGRTLRYADLQGTDLQGTDLQGAKDGKYSIELIPLQVDGLRWHVMILDDAMRIGCEIHLLKDWDGFDDDRIEQMDTNALEFWQVWKEPLFAMAKASGRWSI